MSGITPRPAAIMFLICGLCALPSGLPAQTATEPKDSLRILFDSKGGFKPYHLESSDGSYHPLLNPAADTPVTLEVFRNGTGLPFKLVEETIPAQDDDPGYRGPAFTADDIHVQLWGLDVSASSPNWSVIRYEFTNTASSITTLYIRLLMDTWLGESGREPIQIFQEGANQRTVASDETQLKQDDQFRLVGSAKPDGTDSLFYLLPGKSWPNLSAQRLLIANIRRLQNSGAVFDVEEHRAFNLLPFSINDSALAFCFDSVIILPNQRVAIDVLMIAKPDDDPKNIANLRNAVAAIPISKVKASTAASATSLTPKSGDRDALVKKINVMLATLKALMASPDYKQGDVERLVQAIDEAQKQLQPKP